MNYATSERQFASVLTNCIKLALLCLVGATTTWPQRVAAQQKAYAPAQAQPAARASGGSRPQPSGKSSTSKDSKEGKPEGKEKGKDEKSDGDAKKGEEAKPPEVVMRPGEPPQPPDPKEFELRPDPDGRIRFRFRNQPWPDFLQWLSDVGGYSLDWQQMPGGYLNLITYRSYTITEARDLVNRLLLDRGYTMLLRGQVLSVVKIEKLDPSMLPRVEDESELMDLSPYDFAKITFPLPTKLKAEALAADVKSLLSPNGKVQPLVSSNRLLVIDAVANLRDVSRLINAEHAAADSHQVPREFHIRYVRADYIADQVMILLGLDPSSRRSPNELQVEQQRLQLFMQMQQKGKDVTKFLRGDNAPEVFVTVNKRVNSVLVNAPPDVLVKIERTIEQLDVPSGSAGGSLVAGEPGETGGLVEMRRYALVSLKPESVVTALKEIGNLDPRTMLQMDADAKVIFASATVRDHEKISAIIDKLDGSGREIEVIWLKRLPADQAAVTIHNLLIGKKEEDDSSRNNYYYRRYGGGDDDDKPESDFRVEADIENNRLLLFANKAELEAVNNLLVKLGELPGDSGNPNTIRVQDSRGAKSTADLIRQLQQLWPATANPIRVEGDLPAAEEESESSSADDDRPADTADRDNARTTATPKRPRVQTAVFTQQSGSPASTDKAAQPRASDTAVADDDAKGAGQETLPPITISIANDGRLILSSQDTQALDALEELLQRLSPPPKKHRVFYLQYALASLVKLNLDEYFEDEKSTDSSDNWMRAWMGMDFKEESKNNGLASRRPVRFIYDIDTNSILVRDATPQQMETIAELIEIYDRAPSEESISARRLKVFKLEYSDASVVAATVKDVFRDLLSSKDKEFAGGGDKEKQSSGSSRTFRIFGGGDDDKDSKPTKVKASFEGALSVGVDALSNTIIVSAQEEWLPAIEEIIRYMDQNAKPDTTVVVQSLSVPMDAKSMQTLADLLRPWPGNKKPEGNQPGKQGKEKPNNKQQQPQQNATPQPGNDS